MENKVYMVFYLQPLAVKGAYKVQAEDSTEASKKVEEVLEKTYGDEMKNSHSIILEVPNGSIFTIE